ncbi:hypothetical protein BKA80DRAFT_115294 [Phyllosticta citrichinensis]
MSSTEQRAHHAPSPFCGAAGLDRSKRRGVNISRRGSWPLVFLPRESPTREDVAAQGSRLVSDGKQRCGDVEGCALQIDADPEVQEISLVCKCRRQRLAHSGGAVPWTRRGQHNPALFPGSTQNKLKDEASVQIVQGLACNSISITRESTARSINLQIDGMRESFKTLWEQRLMRKTKKK